MKETITYQCDLCESGGFEARGCIYGFGWEREGADDLQLQYESDISHAPVHVCGTCLDGLVSVSREHMMEHKITGPPQD